MTKPLLRRSRSEPIRRIGEKGTKRHLPVGGRGTPLAIVVTGTNRHTVTQMAAVLNNVVANRPEKRGESAASLFRYFPSMAWPVTMQPENDAGEPSSLHLLHYRPTTTLPPGLTS